MKIFHLVLLAFVAFFSACTGPNHRIDEDSGKEPVAADAKVDPCESFENDCCTLSEYMHYDYSCVLLGRINDEPQCNIGSGDLPQNEDQLARFCGTITSFECTCDEVTGCATVTVVSESTKLNHEELCPGNF